jgi:hypothetical protein
LIFSAMRTKNQESLKSRWDTWLNETLAFPDHKRSAWEGHRLLAIRHISKEYLIEFIVIEILI